MRPQNELLNDQQKEENPVKWLAEKMKRKNTDNENVERRGKPKTLLPQLSCPVSRFSCYCLAFTLLHLHSLHTQRVAVEMVGKCGKW